MIVDNYLKAPVSISSIPFASCKNVCRIGNFHTEAFSREKLNLHFRAPNSELILFELFLENVSFQNFKNSKNCNARNRTKDLVTFSESVAKDAGIVENFRIELRDPKMKLSIKSLNISENEGEQFDRRKHLIIVR